MGVDEKRDDKEPVEAPDATAPKTGGGSWIARAGEESLRKVSAVVALGSAIVLCTTANLFAGRHYHRWDVTASGDFTLSGATRDSLTRLSDDVYVYVLLSKELPLGGSLAELLDGYRAWSPKFHVEFVDPDRDQARILEIQREHALISADAGGRTSIDAAIVMVRGDRHQYIPERALAEVDEADPERVQPRLEYAVTSALRELVAEEKTTVCVTTGHGELPLSSGGVEGMAEFASRLVRSNYDVVSVFEPNAPTASLSACSLLVVAAPRAPVPKEHVDLMVSYIEQGGSAFVAVWPVPNPDRSDWISIGLDPVLALAGVAVRQDLVIEADPSLRASKGDGTIYFAQPAPHTITESLVRGDTPFPASLAFSSSLEKQDGALKPEPLLLTSPRSFGVMDYWRRDVPDRELVPGPTDAVGPLIVASATERPPLGSAKRGARIVVVSAANPLWGATFSSPEFQGTANFTEGAVAWLTQRERFLDIPEKATRRTGLRLTDDALKSVFRYVVVGLPAFTLVTGTMVFLRRRRRPSRSGETR